MGVVDALEMVGIEHHQRQLAGPALPTFQFGLGGFEEGAAVGDAGQVVAGRGAAVRFAGFAFVGDVADDHAIRGLIVNGRQRHGARIRAVPQWRDHGAAPEPRAVGFHAPAVVEAPAVVVGLAQAVEHAVWRGRVDGVENRIGLAEHGAAVESGHAADARVPVVDASAPVQAHQGVVGDAAQDGVEPGFAVFQLPFPPDLQRHITEHRHEPGRVQLEQAQRQHLRVGLAAHAGIQLNAQCVAHHAVGGGELGRQVAQVGGHAFQCGEQVRQVSVA